MKVIRNVLLFIIGLACILFAFWIPALGLDPNPGWGKRRVFILLFGIFMLVLLANSAKIEKLIERAYQQFVDIREKIYDRIHVPNYIRQGMDARVRRKFIYGSVGLAGLVVITVYMWFATAGTWTTWPTSKDYYDQLANAFVHGQVALEREVNPALLTLSDPYNIEARGDIEYLWDASLYQGKYYLYWGPMPAIILALFKLIYPVTVDDNLITFAAAVMNLVFQTLLITSLWMRFFQHLPSWTLLLSILLAGCVIPITWMLNRPQIYEAAILSSQAFLMGGIYFAQLAFRIQAVSLRWLAWASIFWVFAIASRTIVIFQIIFLGLLCLIIIFRRYRLWTASFNKLILALGLPMLLGAIGLGTYNFVRFGSIFEFGVNYQLAGFDTGKHAPDLFSSQHILPNINNYFLNPPKRTQRFPYFRPMNGNETEAFGRQISGFYFSERVTGLVYSFPFVFFACIPALRMTFKKIKQQSGNLEEKERVLQWISVALSGVALIAMASLLSFSYVTMRYFADISIILVVLASMGFWFGYQAVASDRFTQLAYSSFGFSLALVSIIVPNILALVSSGRLETYSPEALQALDALYMSIFSR